MNKTMFAAVFATLALCAGAAEVNEKCGGESAAKAKKDVVVIVATHPDDLGVSLGFCHLAKDVYELHVIDYTHGERGCGEEKYTNGWTKATRTKEEEEVCKTINAKLHWLDEVDGEAYAGRETCHRLAKIFKELQPRAVIGHWPVDIHTDHVMAGAAMLRALFLSEVKCEVWFSGQTYQSKRWTPDVLVDVSGVMDDVVKSLNLYTCQLAGGSMVERQKLAREFYGYQSRKFYDGRCEGYKALVLPMAGDRTIFTDLPKPKGFCESFEFEGVREKTDTGIRRSSRTTFTDSTDTISNSRLTGASGRRRPLRQPHRKSSVSNGVRREPHVLRGDEREDPRRDGRGHAEHLVRE